MRSIYEQALGNDFARLHPKIQERFGFSSKDRLASIGTGVMESVWHGAIYTLPFLYLGAWRRIMFPEYGSAIPFKVENYAYVDSFGRETVTWLRAFNARRIRRFDAYMIYSEKRGCIVDYLGTHQHLAVDLHLSVADNGGLRLLSGEQRFYEGQVGFRFPMILSGIADVCEWYDDETEKYRIQVVVTNRHWGRLFGYTGSFDAAWIESDPNQLPDGVLPRREVRRE